MPYLYCGWLRFRIEIFAEAELRQRDNPGEAGALAHCLMRWSPNELATIFDQNRHGSGPAAVVALPRFDIHEGFDLGA